MREQKKYPDSNMSQRIHTCGCIQSGQELAAAVHDIAEALQIPIHKHIDWQTVPICWEFMDILQCLQQQRLCANIATVHDARQEGVTKQGRQCG